MIEYQCHPYVEVEFGVLGLVEAKRVDEWTDTQSPRPTYTSETNTQTHSLALVDGAPAEGEGVLMGGAHQRHSALVARSTPSGWVRCM